MCASCQRRIGEASKDDLSQSRQARQEGLRTESRYGGDPQEVQGSRVHEYDITLKLLLRDSAAMAFHSWTCWGLPTIRSVSEADCAVRGWAGAPDEGGVDGRPFSFSYELRDLRDLDGYGGLLRSDEVDDNGDHGDA